MPEAISSPWIPFGVLVALALTARRLLGSWLAPSAFVALIWAAYAGVCLIVTDYEVRATGMWMIVGLVFSTQCGAILSQTIGTRSSISRSDEEREDPRFDMLIDRALKFSLLFAFVALVGTIYCIFWSVHRFNLSFSLPDLLSLGDRWSSVRYGEGEVEPWTVRLLIMWVYPAALLGGIVFATASRRSQRLLSFLPLACALLIGAVEATRAGSLISLLCWLSAFLAVRHWQSRGTYSPFSRKLVVSLGAAALCGLLYFLAIDSLRAFQPGQQLEISVDQERLQKYFFGSVPAFSNWFGAYTQPRPTLGAYTFAGIFDLLGLKGRHFGVYDDYYDLGGGEETNIYTLYRGLIEDFTPAGSIVFVFVVGLAAGAAYRSRNHSTGLVILSGYYAFTLYSPVISLFIYNGLILAWCTSALVLGGNTSRQRLTCTAKRAPLVACP